MWTLCEWQAVLVHAQNREAPVPLPSTAELWLMPPLYVPTETSSEHAQPLLRRHHALPMTGPAFQSAASNASTGSFFTSRALLTYLPPEWKQNLDRFTSSWTTWKKAAVAGEESVTKLGVAVDWHPHSQWMAVLNQDVVFLLQADQQVWSPIPLTHPHQQSITCLQWRPYSSRMLAVGTRNGVGLWRWCKGDNLSRSSAHDPNVPSPAISALPAHFHTHTPEFHLFPLHDGDETTVSGSLDQDLMDQDLLSPASPTSPRAPSFSHAVTALGWSPDGRNLLVGQAASGSLRLWDVDTGRGWWVERVAKGGTLSISYSPDGRYVLVSQRVRNGHGRLRLFETRTWKDTVIEYPAPCRNVCWLPDSTCFLFSVQGRAEIHCVRLIKAFPSLAYHFEHIETLEEQRVNGRRCGGVIDQMVLSPSGTRLVVSHIPGASDNDKLLFDTQFLSVFNVKFFGPASLNGDIFLNMGFLHGPMPDALINDDGMGDTSQLDQSNVFLTDPTVEAPLRPMALAFARECSYGALLSICWSNGRVSFLPFLFTPESAFFR